MWHVVAVGRGCAELLGGCVGRSQWDWAARTHGRFAYSTRFGGSIKGFDVEPYLSAKEARKMDLFIQYGRWACRQSVILVWKSLMQIASGLAWLWVQALAA